MSWVKSSIEKPCENIACIMSEVFINLSLGKWGASNITNVTLVELFWILVFWVLHSVSGPRDPSAEGTGRKGASYNYQIFDLAPSSGQNKFS